MKTRSPAVAGSFYPADPFTLRQQIDGFLAVDGGQKTAAAVAPKALLCPHAGIIYSGKTAGIGYAQLLAHRDRIRRVVLLGPTHRVGIRGLAVPSVDAFATPLGEVPIDRAGRTAALRLPQVAMSDAPHLAEHSLEVQLPFLQRALDQFSVLPLAVGEASAAEVAEVIDAVWGGAETLIVISSDLSHFHPYDEAQVIDRDSIDTVLALAGPLDHEQACGATPLNGLLRVAQRRGLRPALLDLRNSGDTAGDRHRVVGYAALRFDDAPLGTAADPPGEIASASASPALGVALLGIARQAINVRLSGVAPEILQEPDLPMLDQPAASFVTLTRNGELRGCIGSLDAHRPLRQDVAENAHAAAFSDPRFAPVSAAEWPQLRVEVSLLTPPETLAVRDEADLRRQLRPGIDGVIFEAGQRRATYLPQIWEQLSTAESFLAQLKQKAGLSPDYWSSDVVIQRYQVQKWTEQ